MPYVHLAPELQQIVGCQELVDDLAFVHVSDLMWRAKHYASLMLSLTGAASRFSYSCRGLHACPSVAHDTGLLGSIKLFGILLTFLQVSKVPAWICAR